MELIEQLRSAGVLPTGMCSAWPKDRHDKLMEETLAAQASADKTSPANSKGPARHGLKKLAGNLAKTTGQAVRYGKVSKEIREERYDTCKACPFFNAESKRCNDCGCFMEAKTWVGGDPDMLCPQKKWSR